LELLKAIELEKPRFMICNQAVTSSRVLLNSLAFGDTALKGAAGRSGLKLVSKSVLGDLRTLDMLEAALREDIEDPAARTNHWVSEYESEDDVRNYVATMFVAQSLNDIVETYGVNNTIIDNCHVYTAFSALDPLTQDKVSKLTGSIGEVRTSRSSPAGFGAGRSSISRSEVERPLLEPGEIRSLPDEEQLVFVAGQRPLRTRKVRYDACRPFRARAAMAAPAPTILDSPGVPSHPWAGRRALGENPTANLPLFKEVVGAMDDKRAAQRAAQIYERMAGDLAAQEAVLDHLQGRSDV